MAIVEAAERSRKGHELQGKLTGMVSRPATVLDLSWRDFVYAEVWSRPGLDLRARFLISIAGAASSNGPSRILDGYVRGAIATQALTAAELREAALHLAVYTGWLKGVELDDSISRVIEELGLLEQEPPAIQTAPWNSDKRVQQGIEEFDNVMGFPGPAPVTPYFEAGIDSFVFAEMWKRPGLDQRSRRWITLVGVSESCAVTPIKTHFYAALSSGNCTADELQEFVLQYAVHAGWPKASVIQGAVLQMVKNYNAGRPWNAA